MVNAAYVVSHLCAQRAAGKRVSRITAQIHCAAIFNARQHGACVWTIMRAGAPNGDGPLLICAGIVWCAQRRFPNTKSAAFSPIMTAGMCVLLET